MNNNNQMSFNPITNQPFNIDNKTPNIEKEKEANKYNIPNKQMDQMNTQERFQMKGSQKGQQIPVEYNPYKQPYSIYQGRP
jgi:hypothetical protein